MEDIPALLVAENFNTKSVLPIMLNTALLNLRYFME